MGQVFKPGGEDQPLPLLTRFGDLYGASECMQKLFHMIQKVAPTRANVLVSGESGTGKELVASTIHGMSDRRDKPFVALNCGAVSSQLIEAELFGHEKGSFTGAVRMHKGCFERASSGTLFLDEVTEMSMEMQVKLLRVLETGKISRVGGDSEIEVDVRVIAATNREPADAVATGLMRSDLYYRLAVFPIYMPALRERGQDIELLAHLFLSQLNAQEGEAKIFAPSSLDFMSTYAWPGNVRELKNAVQRAFILAEKELELFHDSAAGRPVPCVNREDCISLDIGSGLAEAERKIIYATLDYCGGNKTRTAEMLGISLKTLYNRLNEYEGEEKAAPEGDAMLPGAGTSLN
jgi:DNA-binding NtrC family response regulator